MNFGNNQGLEALIAALLQATQANQSAQPTLGGGMPQADSLQFDNGSANWPLAGSAQQGGGDDEVNSFWNRAKAAYTGRGPGGRVSDESIGRASMAHGGLSQIGEGLSQAFNSGGPISSLPRGYVGPGAMRGDRDQGLQQLISMMLARG